MLDFRAAKFEVSGREWVLVWWEGGCFRLKLVSGAVQDSPDFKLTSDTRAALESLLEALEAVSVNARALGRILDNPAGFLKWRNRDGSLSVGCTV